MAREETAGVKDRRVERFLSDFHAFAMQREFIQELEIRYTHLIYNLTALERRILEK